MTTNIKFPDSNLDIKQISKNNSPTNGEWNTTAPIPAGFLVWKGKYEKVFGERLIHQATDKEPVLKAVWYKTVPLATRDFIDLLL